MNTATHEIIKLITLYMQGELSEAQRKKLSEWLAADPNNRDFFDRTISLEHVKQKLSTKERINQEKAFQQFKAQVSPSRKTITRKILAYAAVIAVPIILGLLAIISRQETPTPKMPSLTEITHGKPKAILTLAQGEKIELSPEQALASLPTGLRLKEEKDELIYTPQETSGGNIQYHELTTPRGGEYKITLPDGSFVHLNSNTTLRFPNRFDESKREIYLTGEAYFEVSKDSKRPFYVITDIARVKVHGTTFNVNTLLNNQIQTTLLQGSIGIFIQGENREYLLQPSQQAEISYTTKTITIKEVDVAPYVAWKDGIFMFDDERLESILDKLALWYDFEVFYQNEMVKDIRFTGFLKRYDNINIILDAIETTVSVDFDIQGKNIIIYKNDYTK